MKITKSKLRSLIKEELSNYEEIKDIGYFEREYNEISKIINGTKLGDFFDRNNPVYKKLKKLDSEITQLLEDSEDEDEELTEYLTDLTEKVGGYVDVIENIHLHFGK